TAAPQAAGAPAVVSQQRNGSSDIPLFGARGKARELAVENAQLRSELDQVRVELTGLRAEMSQLGELFRDRAGAAQSPTWS
ncbi:hypothetical protein, partial [Salinispora arenicola]|uniref:hypothetical protein n=1 Tax=Salinispora arenicola TaxID=168697 RepID=UPI0027DBB7CA